MPANTRRRGTRGDRRRRWWRWRRGLCNDRRRRRRLRRGGVLLHARHAAGVRRRRRNRVLQPAARVRPLHARIDVRERDARRLVHTGLTGTSRDWAPADRSCGSRSRRDSCSTRGRSRRPGKRARRRRGRDRAGGGAQRCRSDGQGRAHNVEPHRRPPRFVRRVDWMIRRAARQYRLFVCCLRNSMHAGGVHRRRRRTISAPCSALRPPPPLVITSGHVREYVQPMRLSHTIARPHEARLLSPAMRKVLLLLVVTASVACIKRSAPPASMAAPAAGTTGAAPAAAAPPPVDDYTKPNPVQDAANARIAAMPRTDLVGAAGLGAFKVMGETARRSRCRRSP